ncbi:protein eva-1 homolog C-like isoform X3 [Paroedura picta]|uniref:protein eva-1 homolog C-like isoform X3 n=1 Tax=Paroedura picta TaxID=143630 RepID=UPI004057AD3C
MPGPWRMSWFWTSGAALSFLWFSALLKAAPEFSGYLQKVLKNQTAHACDGGQLTIICPHKTSISVLSAFYGRRVPSQNLCPASGEPISESTNCVSATARQKLMDECQDQRWCHFSVHSRVFGPDPCPGTHKYLVVSYKCRPANHRLKTVCENDKLRLQCRNKSVLAIYSALYGRPLRGKPECEAANGTIPDIECLAPDALRKVSQRCHRKGNCSVAADKSTFGNPCFPGVKKQLRVSYTCAMKHPVFFSVPRKLLEEVGRDSHEDPFSISDYTHGGWYTGPRLARLHENLMIFTSSLETFAHVWAGRKEAMGTGGHCSRRPRRPAEIVPPPSLTAGRDARMSRALRLPLHLLAGNLVLLPPPPASRHVMPNQDAYGQPTQVGGSFTFPGPFLIRSSTEKVEEI